MDAGGHGMGHGQPRIQAGRQGCIGVSREVYTDHVPSPVLRDAPYSVHTRSPLLLLIAMGYQGKNVDLLANRYYHGWMYLWPHMALNLD